MTQIDKEAVERLKSALQSRATYPEYAHKVHWAVAGALRKDLLRYGRAWEATSGPVGERGGSPMEVGEEIVAEAEHALVSRMVALMDAALDAAEARERAAVAAFAEKVAEIPLEYEPCAAPDAIRALADTDALAEYVEKVRADHAKIALSFITPDMHPDSLVKWVCEQIAASIRQESVTADRILTWRGDVLTEQTDPATLLEVIAHLDDETDALRKRLFERLSLFTTSRETSDG
jgi:hypothetical protein